ncbi:MAG: hypothetical protein V1809_00360 [Planctomycetota bacterium]
MLKKLAILTGSLTLLAIGAATAADEPGVGRPDFTMRRAGRNFDELAWEIGTKTEKIRRAKGNPAAPPHLVLLLDSTSSACRYLEEFQKSIGELFKRGPKNLQVSVVALRSQPAVVNTNMVEVKEVRRAIMQVVTEGRDSQTRAKVQLKPEQRIQIAAWESLTFATPDDCIKDWCAGVRFCLKTFGTDYPIDALCVFTLDNADTENNVEGLVTELTAARTTLIACAPETLLTTSDPMTYWTRQKAYDEYKKLINLDYGATFAFHRRESSVNEVIPVSGLGGPAENSGNTTGYGFYGLSRVGWATSGAYFLISPIAEAQCACMFHGPGDRLTRWLWNDEAMKPPKIIDIINGKAPVAPVIKACEFEAENQGKYFPSFLSRVEVDKLYASSPYYQYLFSLGQGRNTGANTGTNWHWGERNHWHWGEGEYTYLSYAVSPWDLGGKAPDASADELPRLRVSSEWRWPPGVHNVHFVNDPAILGGYASFYTTKSIEAVKKYLDGAIPQLVPYIQKVKDNIPRTPPGPNDQRALAEIEYFIMSLENQLFYVKQYRYFLDMMLKDDAALATLKGNGNVTKGGMGVPYLEIRMPRVLKQRCEEFAKAMSQRGPIYGGEPGKTDLARLLTAKREFTDKVGQTTWTNFFDLAWMTNYHWVRLCPVPSGPGTSPRPKMPLPPSYGDPGTPKGPSGGSQAD